MRLRRGDTVRIMAGKGRIEGSTGKVKKVLLGSQMVIIEGQRILKRHVKPGRRQSMPQGGMLEVEAPIRISNVALVCNHCGQPTRTGVRFLDDGRKVRTCKKCGKDIG